MQIIKAISVLGLTAGAAAAGGVDRSGQPIGVIFERGNYMELSFGNINPSVSGVDGLGRATGGVAGNHTLPGIAIKYDFNTKLSGALIYDRAYGADILYPVANTPMLGGTMAKLRSHGITALLRYRFDDNFSVHGGIRASRASGDVTLAGLGYGPFNGYNASFKNNWGTGFVVGGAYEIPDIALRVALTYFSEVKHGFDTTQSGGPASPAGITRTDVKTPQAVNLDFQTGIAPDTLLFGSIRWVDWKEFQIRPSGLLGSSLTEIENTTTYTLGVGRKFNDSWSGSAFLTYEPTASGQMSPLAPTNGMRGIGVAAVYTRDNMKLTMGARYIKLGDADTTRGGAVMRDNDAVALGVKLGFSF